MVNDMALEASFWGGGAASACLLLTVLFFHFDLRIFGAIGILVFFLSSGCGISRAVRDIRQKSIDQAAKDTE